MKRTLALLTLALLGAACAQSSLYRALIVAADGTFLGTCENEYASNSIANAYGKYGSEYQTNSMFNPYSRYGNEYSTYSAYNEYTSSAPYLLAYDPELYAMFTSVSYRPSDQIARALRSSGAARVSKNDALYGALDPDLLRAACKRL